MRLFCLISIILLAASAAFADPLSLDLVYFGYTAKPYTMRDGSAAGGAMATSDPSTGVAVNVQSIVSAYADISKYRIWDWGEDAKGRETINWMMELALLGEPGASAEVLGKWDLWLAYLIGCEPDGLLIEATNASIETGISIWSMQTVCLFGVCGEIPWPISGGSVGDMEIWFGVDGGGKEIYGDFSLGTYNVGDHFYLWGTYDSLAWADEEDFGRADSWGYSNFDLRLNVQGLPIPDPPTPDPPDPPDPPRIPEPTSFILLGTGLGALGLVVWRRKK